VAKRTAWDTGTEKGGEKTIQQRPFGYGQKGSWKNKGATGIHSNRNAERFGAKRRHLREKKKPKKKQKMKETGKLLGVKKTLLLKEKKRTRK